MNASPNPDLQGSVSLVGAGPGDPELLTLRALKRIRSADVVVYDRLVSRAVIDMIPETTEKIFVGKLRECHLVPQGTIHDILILHARAGRHVVRLKGGDPMVFGRAGEELQALLDAGITYDIVPGITAATGCAATTATPLTHRDHAQMLILATGHRKEGGIELDWALLASANQTIVLYMGFQALKVVTGQLLDHGLSPDTPICLVENGTMIGQRRVRSTLSTILDDCRDMTFSGPVLTMIGQSIALGATFEQGNQWSAMIDQPDVDVLPEGSSV